jgi:hypothetical protein
MNHEAQRNGELARIVRTRRTARLRPTMRMRGISKTKEKVPKTGQVGTMETRH